MSLLVVQDRFLRYKYVSVSADETKITARILMPIVEGNVDCHREALLSTDPLLGKYIAIGKGDTCQMYAVVAEHIFDRTKGCGEQWWKLGESVDFVYDTVSVNKGIVQSLPLSLLSNLSQETKYEYCARRGLEILASVRCNSDKVCECDVVIMADERGIVFSNLTNENTVVIPKNQFEPAGSNFKVLIEGSSLVTSNSTHQYILSIVDCENNIVEQYNEEIYIETDAGYLPKTKVRMNNGRARIDVCTLMVDSGVTFELRCHSRYYGLKATKLITVK